MSIKGTQVLIYTITQIILKNKQNKDWTIKQKLTNNMKAWKKDADA